MTKNGKTVKRDNINSLLTRTDLTTDERAYLENELALLDRKNASAKASPEEIVLKNSQRTAILDHMTEGTKYSVTEICTNVDACKGLSNSYVTSLLRTLVTDGMVTNVKEKGKSYYQIVE